MHDTSISFFFSFFLSAKCNVEDGLHQLHSFTDQPHTRLMVYNDHIYSWQFISDVTPLKLEQKTLGKNLSLELLKISFHPFQLNNQLGK